MAPLKVFHHKGLFYKMIKAGLILLLAVFFLMSLYYANAMVTSSKVSRNTSGYKAHYAAVLIGTETAFLESIQKGLMESATEMNCAVEIYRVDSIQEAVIRMRMLMLAGVDGLIVQGLHDEHYIETLREILSEKIPVVLIYTDNLSVQRDAFVGINPFEMGSKLALLWSLAGAPKGDIILMTQSLVTKGEDQNAKLQSLGFKDTLEKRGYTNHIILEKSEATILSAEGLLAERLILDTDQIGSVVCTTLNDTLGVTQVIIDLNRVGKVRIVGTGFNNQIADYIEKGVIQGTLFRNPEGMGEIAISTLNGIRDTENNRQSKLATHVEMPLEMITKDNLEDFVPFLEREE